MPLELLEKFYTTRNLRRRLGSRSVGWDSHVRDLRQASSAIREKRRRLLLPAPRQKHKPMLASLRTT